MYWSAFLMGFLGSFHCIGMCGPIVLAMPHRGVTYKIIYNLGRTTTYAFIGALVGFLGEGFSMVGLQQTLSIAVGVIMLVFILFTKYKHFNLPLSGPVNRLYLAVKKKLGPLLISKSIFSPFIVGLLNGLLPCGLVYAAMLIALSMGSISGGVYYMIFFGLGTIPIMLSLGVFSGFITPAIRTKLNRAVPYFLAIVAILLILRGMGLGIPYVSPNLDNTDQMDMHHHM